jgi:hypothetical protein
MFLIPGCGFEFMVCGFRLGRNHVHHNSNTTYPGSQDRRTCSAPTNRLQISVCGADTMYVVVVRAFGGLGCGLDFGHLGPTIDNSPVMPPNTRTDTPPAFARYSISRSKYVAMLRGVHVRARIQVTSRGMMSYRDFEFLDFENDDDIKCPACNWGSWVLITPGAQP